jgi:hypothetical protein
MIPAFGALVQEHRPAHGLDGPGRKRDSAEGELCQGEGGKCAIYFAGTGLSGSRSASR